ncbi:MAG TPA: hypothetical protein VFW95_00825 [Candidatus Limnocylindria bacterium]|nr:hypothetical protein [Candidatus Limnocylindria bacterium]
MTPDRDLTLTRIVVRRAALSEPMRLAWAIRAADSWLGPEAGDPAIPGGRRHAADLKLRADDGPTLLTFHKAAYVDLGPVRETDEGWEVEIGWRASSFAPLFPVFSGAIVARAGELTLSGKYAPPGGAIGRAADRALLHIAAEGTARWLLARLDEAAALGGATSG